MDSAASLLTADVALFVDVDNIWLACRNDDLPFLPRAIHERARLLGRVIMARAYADWSEGYLYDARLKLQEEAFDLIQLPGDQRGKNTADIQLALDALEAALGPRPPHTIVIVSGDRDFVPLARKLKQYRVEVVGIAAASATGKQFKNACDSYIEYDDLVAARMRTAEPEPESEQASAPPAPCPPTGKPAAKAGTPPPPAKLDPDMVPLGSHQELVMAFQNHKRRDEARRLLVKAVARLEQQGVPAVGAAVMQTMQRIDNSFSLEKFGKYSKFMDLAEDAESAGIVEISGKGTSGDITLNLTGAGHSQASSGSSSARTFADPTIEARHYAELMRRKRVILVPEPWRTTLVTELFAELADMEGGMSIAEMNNWMFERAFRHHGLSFPSESLRKLIWSLNLTSCFQDKYGITEVQRDETMECRTSIPVEVALEQMEKFYVTGVLLEDPEAPLEAEAVAIWLYGEKPTQEQIDRAAATVDRARRRR